MKRVKFYAKAILTCEPGSIALIAAATASTIGAGVSMYSSVKSGEAQKDAADYNAEMSRMKAQDSLQRGAIEAAAKQDRARKIAGSQREGAAMSGVAVDSGTPLDLLVETAGLGELDARRTMNNAHREAWGLGAQADLDEFQGKTARTGGYLNAAGTFLSSAASSYYGYRSATGMKKAA